MRRLLFVSKHYSSDFGLRVAGIFQRMRMLLDAAARSADRLDILFFVDQDIVDRVGPEPARETLARHWGIDAAVHLAPRATRAGGRLANLVGPMLDFRSNDDFFRYCGPAQVAAVRALVTPETDLVLAHRIYAAASALRAVGDEVPVVTDLDDIEHRTQLRMWFQAPRTLSRMLRIVEYPALKRGELATIAACRDAFVCSSQDQRYLRALGAVRTTVIPNTARFPDASKPATAPPAKTLLFIGTYAYPPNRDAAEYLIGTIFPLVLARSPDVTLTIAGEAVDRLPSHARAPANVHFAGYVPDLSDAYRSASVVCCPILVGGGTRIKIIEAAAHRRPIVSTSAGAEGLDFIDGEEILLRDGAEAFASACLELLDDPARATRLGQAAHDKARAHYERGAVVDRVAGILRAAARGAGP